MRSSLMRILHRRFGAEAEQLRPAIETIGSLERLESLMDLALDAPTLQAFADALSRDASSVRPSE
jgi:hypothetical protein